MNFSFAFQNFLQSVSTSQNSTLNLTLGNWCLDPKNLEVMQDLTEDKNRDAFKKVQPSKESLEKVLIAVGDILKKHGSIEKLTIQIDSHVMINLHQLGKIIGEILIVPNKLKELDISKNEMEDRDLVPIAQALSSNVTLTSLNLSENNIGGSARAFLFIGSLRGTTKSHEVSGPQMKQTARPDERQGIKLFAEALLCNKSLTKLDLKGNRLGPDGVKILVTGLRKNYTVTYINLDGNEIDNGTVESIAALIEGNTSLKWLCLDNNPFGNFLRYPSILTFDDKDSSNQTPLIARAIEQNTSLEFLSMSALKYDDDYEDGYELIGPFLHDKGAEALAKALKINTTLKTLSIVGNNIGARGMQSIAQALKVNRSLTELNLRGNFQSNITDIFYGVSNFEFQSEPVFEALKCNNILHVIDLSELKLGFPGSSEGEKLKSVAEAIQKNKSLLEVSLAGNNIFAIGAQVLSIALIGNQTLRKLNLSRNKLGIKGRHYNDFDEWHEGIARKFPYLKYDIVDERTETYKLGLRTYTRRSVAVAVDNITEFVGINFLSNVLKSNQFLTHLNLSDNNILSDGINVLADALKINRSLVWIDLDGNHVGDDGAKLLAEALKINDVLLTISVRRNQIKRDGEESLSHALINNRRIILDHKSLIGVIHQRSKY